MLEARPSQNSSGLQATFQSVGVWRASGRPVTPLPSDSPSVKASLGSWQEVQEMVPVEESSLSSKMRLPSAILVGVGGLPGGLVTNPGRANFSLSVASGSADCWARAPSVIGHKANVAIAANPAAAAMAN